MNYTKICRRLATIGTAAFVGMVAFASPISTLTVHAAEAPVEASPRAADIQWRYKVENGKTYKRLFNYSTNQWVGDWILVG